MSDDVINSKHGEILDTAQDLEPVLIRFNPFQSVSVVGLCAIPQFLNPQSSIECKHGEMQLRIQNIRRVFN